MKVLYYDFWKALEEFSNKTHTYPIQLFRLDEEAEEIVCAQFLDESVDTGKKEWQLFYYSILSDRKRFSDKEENRQGHLQGWHWDLSEIRSILHSRGRQIWKV